MKQHLLRGALFFFALLFIFGDAAFAQSARQEGVVYLRPKIGVSYYLGDNEKSPFTFNFDAYEVDGKFPYAAGLEIGYQFNPRYSLGLGFTFSDYPIITQFSDATSFSSKDHPTTRASIQLAARYLLSQGRIAPYVQAGLHASFGKTAVFEAPPSACLTTGACPEESRTGFGPLLGIGLDFMLSPRASFFIETNANITFPDDAADGWDGKGSVAKPGGFGPADWLNSATLGFKFNITKPFVPVQVLMLDGPSARVTGENGTYTGTTNADATQPVTYAWDFGDGTSATGLTATHQWGQPGTYTVTLTAANKKSSDSRSMTVAVTAACQAAEIVTMTASTMSPDTQTAVAFSANVRGTAPLTYRWDFGDGQTSTEASPRHTYATAGTYTVTLEVTNCGGTVRRTVTVTAVPYEAAICREITEMNSVYFGNNSSTLTAEARAMLQENLEILQECPNLNVRIEGYAAPGERNAQKLSEDRARAVEQFYRDNGIAASRMATSGKGRVAGMTSKKEGANQYRRVDTIPVR